MGARDEVIDKVADAISDTTEARMFAKVVQVPPRRFPQAGDMRSFWEAVITVLEEHHGKQSFSTLFAAIGKDYPRTVAECEAILDASPDHGAASARNPRPIRILRGGKVVTRIAGGRDEEFVVQIGARTPDEAPPQLEIVGEQASDTIGRGAPELKDKAQWWEVAVSFKRAGMRSRNLALRVVDEPDAGRANLTLSDARLVMAARVVAGACAVACAAVLFGVVHSALALVPVLAIAAAGASVKIEPLARVFAMPRYLFAGGAALFALMWVPGRFSVGVDNETGQPIVIGETIGVGESAVVRPDVVDAASARYCITASGGLFMPRVTVKTIAPQWTVVENTFSPEVIAKQLEVEGGTREDRVVTVRVAPPQCTGAQASASLVRYLSATIRIPYGWTLSSFTDDGKELLKLVHVFGAPKLDYSTKLVVTDKGDLACESGSPIVLEPLPEIPDAKNLELTTEGEGGTSSHWRSTSPRAWRCKIKSRTNAIVMTTTGVTDFELPKELGEARLTIDGSKIDVPTDARMIKRRDVSPDASLPTGAVALEDGGRATIDANHILMAVKDGRMPQNFKKNNEDYSFEIKGAREVIKIDKGRRIIDPRLFPRIIPTTPTGPTDTTTPRITKPVDHMIKAETATPKLTKPVDHTIKAETATPKLTKPVDHTIKATTPTDTTPRLTTPMDRTITPTTPTVRPKPRINPNVVQPNP